MAEPIRKPLHRPRPPHPHVQKRPHAVLVRSRELPEETPEPEARHPQPAPARPALVPAPPRREMPESSLPERDVFVAPPPAIREEERSARTWLWAALALHLLVLLAAWLGQPASGLAPEDLLLAAIVLLSGGTMLLVGGRKR